MSKVFPGVPGIPLTNEEDENYNRWKHLQKHSRAIMKCAFLIDEAGEDAPRRDAAIARMLNAVQNYKRLGGKVEDVKHFL